MVESRGGRRETGVSDGWRVGGFGGVRSGEGRAGCGWM